jgi:hypothetical protein
VKKVLYDSSTKVTVTLENFKVKIKKIKFEKSIPIKKVNQSVVILVLTVMFFTYVATKDIIRYVIELSPKGVPITTSFISPAKKMFPFPSISGLFKVQK